MKRLSSTISLLILLSFLVVYPASAAVKAGAVCNKLNSVTTQSGFKFTCIKSGKILVWSKGQKVSVPMPTATQSSQVEPKEITNFQDAIDRAQDVSYWAWKKSYVQIQSNNSKGPSVDLIIGPNTKLSNPNPLLSFETVSRLYPDYRKPNKVFAIYYSFKDIDWAQAKYKDVYSESSGQEAKNSCQSIEFCWGASGTINKAGDGVLLAAVMTSNPDINHTSGTLEAHEYTHILQIGSFYGTPNQSQAMCCIKAFTPWWFVEGGAEFSQIAAIYSSSFTNYARDRRVWAKDLLENKNRKFTEEWISNFIKPPDTKIWMDSETQWHLYDLGMLVSEIFTAIKGPAINIQIFKDISEGMTYETSFEKHFGTKWDSAVPLLAKSISKLTNN
jgi:hypothetical protein